jgi:two-component system, chemotaxis family, sensor histidine kinase and response regulator PixL
MHLVRNCFDHGIEATADRLAKGKPAEGTIELSASYRGDNTVIILKDDGGGINLDKIRAKALTMGFTAADLDQASRSDLLNLIFEPGFSTAEQVTALSGRGVGMDVVRTNLTEVGGTIAIETEADRGTTFTITVPLSLAVRRVLLVESQGFWMAFPSSIVEEFQLLHPEQVNAAGDEVEWQGDWIPLITLDRHLQFARPQRRVIQEAQPLIDRPLVLIVGHQDQPYAIQVDRYWGEQEFTSRGVTGRRSLPTGFSSCVVLGDGRIVPLVDLEALLDRVVFAKLFPTPGTAIAPQAIAPTQIAQTTIMVIDDSINVRRFLALTLEKANYRVEQAKDGQDAIDKLKAGTIVDAIICDVEMPRLDGFGFLAQVKTLPQHRHIPVTMLTSRSGTKHRQLALSLGATAYFSKPFKQQDLLATLAELTAPAQAPVQELQSIGVG